jgi:hypothetical protein
MLTAMCQQKTKMKVGIVGTRGIPNFYGGFEQFAQYLSEGLVERGHEVVVYNSHTHPYQESSWNGVQIVHCNDPEDRMGTVGQFFYDLNCILDSRKRDFDIILQLGYTSSSIWSPLFKKGHVVATNMDGLEWKRSKYSRPVQQYLKWAERLGVVFSDFLIADSVGIQDYLAKKYKKESVYIPYGANVFKDADESVLTEWGLKPFQYDMLIARLEPENNIETILEGFSRSTVERQMIVVGNVNTKYGQYIQAKYSDDRINYIGYVSGIEKLDSLRYYSNIYFHGHTVGGTNPSLLEAMASNALICAHNNVFNKAILGEDALYFDKADDIVKVLEESQKELVQSELVNNTKKIDSLYSWPCIIEQYEDFLLSCLKNR